MDELRSEMANLLESMSEAQGAGDMVSIVNRMYELKRGLGLSLDSPLCPDCITKELSIMQNGIMHCYACNSYFEVKSGGFQKLVLGRDGFINSGKRIISL